MRFTAKDSIARFLFIPKQHGKYCLVLRRTVTVDHLLREYFSASPQETLPSAPEKPYPYLVPPKHLEETSLAADLVLNARLDDLAQEGIKVGERPGRKPPIEDEGGAAGGAGGAVSSTAEARPSASATQDEDRNRDRRLTIVGSNLYDVGDLASVFEDDAGDLAGFDIPDRFEDRTEAEWVKMCLRQSLVTEMEIRIRTLCIFSCGIGISQYRLWSDSLAVRPKSNWR